MDTTMVKPKYHLIDAFRGIAIINMVLFHFCYDYFTVYRGISDWFEQPFNRIWQQFICFSFLIIAGISFHFSRHNLKRSIKLNLLGLLITLVTYLFMPSQIIIFGILNCIGCCIFIVYFLDKILVKCSPYLGVFLSIILFAFTRYIVYADLSLPAMFYQHNLLIPFGFPPYGFFSSDYFPIFPWIFLVLLGYFLFPIIKSHDNISIFFMKKVPILSNIGTYSIWIYLVHQPLCMLLCELLFRCTEFT